MEQVLGDRIIDAIERRESLLAEILRLGPKVLVYDGRPLAPPDRIDIGRIRALRGDYKKAQAEVEQCTREYRRHTHGEASR
jgi:hypothetical protein